MVSGPIEINKITDYWSYLASVSRMQVFDYHTTLIPKFILD